MLGRPHFHGVPLVIVALLLALASPLASQEIDWQNGPTVGELGSVAQIQVPAGYRFAGKKGAQMLLSMTQNPYSGNELGVLVPDSEDEDAFWFVIFEYDESGYVKDDEQNELDGDAILKSIRQGTEAANEIRRERGWPTLEIVGWQQRPFYNPETNNLTWSIRGRNQASGEESVNYSVRILGRGGTMNADLVLSAEQLPTVLPEFGDLIAGFSYTEGNRYAQWREGDPVAAYGLTALVVGGAGVAAVKSGLLARLWKVIVLGAVAVVTAVKRFFGRLTQRKEPEAGSAGR